MSDLPYPNLPPTHRYNSPHKFTHTYGNVSAPNSLPATERAAWQNLPLTEAAARRQRILLKLSAYWVGAQPDRPLADVLNVLMNRYSLRESELRWDTSDEELEAVLDTAIKRCELSVSGGWRS